jgi:8-oxo-dGTP pyrophosphatase MutT (NUDIX family)
MRSVRVTETDIAQRNTLTRGCISGKYSSMHISEITHDHPDSEHAEALKTTGFWGKQGAGAIFLAKATGRIGIVHRSNNPPPRRVEQPGTWGSIGGAVDPGEDLETAVKREGEEEVGYAPQAGDYLVHLDEFTSGTFRYTTFLYVVNDEFTTTLNWEAQDFRWFTFGEWPTPLHFGLISTFGKQPCMDIIRAEIAKYHA